MKKIVLKLSREDFGIISKLALEKYNNIIHEDVATLAYKVIFKEISGTIATKLFMHSMQSMNLHKEVSIKIIESHALTFYSEFHGEGLTDHISGIIQQVCKQIEIQLFIQGEYKV